MRTILFIISLALPLAVICQIKIGVESGPVYSSLSLKNETQSEIALPGGSDYGNKTGHITPMIGYSAGLVADLRLADAFSIRAGLRYIVKGWKDDVKYFEDHSSSSLPPKSYDYQETYRLSYFSFPFYLLFSPPLRTRRLIIGIGPTFGFAVSGKYIFHVNQTTDPSIKDSVDMIGIHDYQRRRAALNANNIDLGLAVIAGMEFRNGLFFHLGFNPGLKNVMTDRYGPFINRYINISATIGYFIGKL
jgi:hypothetical protein